MERQIGEIFEYSGEWYQCINTGNCSECAFTGKRCYDFSTKVVDIIGDCTGRTFKKLEKVGEPYDDCGTILQRFKIYTNVTNADTKGLELHIYSNDTIGIEIKQIKEDMGKNKTPLPKEDNPLTRIVYAYVNGKISDNELIKSIKEMSDEYPYNTNNIKPFSLEAVKAGKPVCTRDGRKARIICFDREYLYKGRDYSIVALVADPIGETVHYYFSNGKVDFDRQLDDDLVMLPEKKEGWVNVYYDNDASSHRGCRYIYDTKEQAIKEAGSNYITTIKITWEE